ncbi:MAG: ABC transporter ATP-binding protein [Pseudomonadota bacterium]
MSISVKGLSFAYGSSPVLENFEISSLKRGSITALIGPNAAGKSTALKCIAGLLPSEHGAVQLNNRLKSEFTTSEWSKLVCYMPQTFVCNAALTVFEVVLLARKHLYGWRVQDCDIEVVSTILQTIGIADLAQQPASELSGGQQQLVSVAQTLVREPDVLLLDEPTSALDLRHQLEVMDLLVRTTRARGVVTIAAMHDLNLAARFADNLVLMRKGRVLAKGPPEMILRSTEISDTYGVQIEVQQARDGKSVVSAKL